MNAISPSTVKTAQLFRDVMTESWPRDDGRGWGPTTPRWGEDQPRWPRTQTDETATQTVKIIAG